MTKSLFFNQRNYWLIAIMSIMAVLIFCNIGNSLLWKDEAITANIGYNTLKYGYPKIWDGVNLISSTDGNSFNQLLVSSNYEWLQFYLCAISFAVFGKTTFAARLPFALFALFSVLVVWLIAEKMFDGIKKTICCTFFYGLNVQFLLYSFQSRYYSLVLFGTALCIYCVLHIEEKIIKMKKIKWRDYLFLTGATALIFHSNRVSGFAVATSIIVYLLYRYKRKALELIGAVSIGVLTWVVWFFVNSILLQAPSFGTESIETHIFTKILMIIWKIQVYFFPIISILILYFIIELFVYKKSEKKVYNHRYILFMLIIVMNILYVAVPHWGIVNHYFVSILVVAPFVLTAFIVYCYSHSKYMAGFIALVLVFTNLLNVWPYYLIEKNAFVENNDVNNLLSENSTITTNYGLISSPNTDGNFRIQSLNEYLETVEIKSYIYEYISELINGTETYMDEVVKLLNENSQPDDTVLVLGFEYEPIVFYTNLRVVNNMTTKIKPWPDLFLEYPNQSKFEYLTLVEDEEIDWIVYKNDGSESVMFNDKDYLEKNKDKFQRIETNNSNVPLSNSPDLDYHKFSKFISNDKVIVYKRIE